MIRLVFSLTKFCIILLTIFKLLRAGKRKENMLTPSTSISISNHPSRRLLDFEMRYFQQRRFLYRDKKESSSFFLRDKVRINNFITSILTAECLSEKKID